MSRFSTGCGHAMTTSASATGPSRRSRADLYLSLNPGDGLYVCDGPGSLLIDTCNGVSAIDRASAVIGVRSVAIMEASWRSALERRPIAVDVA